MDTTSSTDGTTIAYRVVGGDGPTVVVVNGALSLAADAEPLAEALVDVGFRAVVWDRRARGASGDAPDTTPQREAEDLGAVIAAIGGDAIVLGHSSGAMLTLFAASLGVPMTALFLSEPPVRFGVDDPPADLTARVAALVDAGRGEDAVAAFQTEAVGIPAEAVEGMRASGQLAALAPLGRSVVHDLRLSDLVSDPAPELLAVRQPVTVLRGEQTFPMLVAGADRLATAIEGADLVVVPESVMHRPDPVATARVVRDRVR